MATDNLGKTISRPSAINLAAYQYHFVKSSSGKVTYCGDGEDADGILQNDPAAADREACISVGEGDSKVVVGGTVTIDHDVASDALGRAVDAVTGDHILGRAREGATVAGTIITILQRASHPVLS